MCPRRRAAALSPIRTRSASPRPSRDALGCDAGAREALGDPQRELRDARRLVGRALADDESLEVPEEALLPGGKERREDAGAAHARNSVMEVVNRARTSCRTATPVPAPRGTGMRPSAASRAGSTTSSSK